MAEAHYYRNHAEIIIWEGSEDFIKVHSDGQIELYIDQGAILGQDSFTDLVKALSQAAALGREWQAVTPRPEDRGGPVWRKSRMLTVKA
jgi:hypothetical protein